MRAELSGVALTAFTATASCTMVLDIGDPILRDGGGSDGATKLVTVEVIGPGVVTSLPDVLQCPPSCSGAFEVGSTVLLIAEPDQGASFDGWIAGCSSDNDTCDFYLNTPRQVTARFFGGAPIRAAHLKGEGDQIAYAVAIGVDGAPVVVGSFDTGIDFGEEEFTSVDAVDGFVARYTSLARIDTARQVFGDSGGVNIAFDVVTADNDAPIVVGRCANNVSFDDGVRCSDAAQGDAFVAKYNRNLVTQWSRSFGQADADTARAVDLDTNEIAHVTGAVCAPLTPIDLGTGGRTTNGPCDSFLLSLDSGGNTSLFEVFGGNDRDDMGTDVFASHDPAHVFIGGVFNGSADFGAGIVTPADGATDAVALQLRASDAAFEKALVVSGADATEAVVGPIAGDRGAFTAVTFAGTVQIGSRDFESVGGTDVVLVDGLDGGKSSNYVHSRSSGDNTVTAIAADSEGGYVIAGRYSTGADFGTGGLGGAGVFVARYDSAGESVWVSTFSNASDAVVTDLAIETSGRIWMVGSFRGTLDLEPADTFNATDTDSFLVQLGQ